MDIPSLQPGCPWYELSTMVPPNIKWCEASLCAWITEPANTWSNLAYLAAALAMWREAGRSVKTGARYAELQLFAPAAIAVGMFSFVYHASYNFITQFFDFIGMFVFLGLLLTLNFRRAGYLGERGGHKFYAALIVGGGALTILFYYVGIPIQLIVLVLILIVIGTEVGPARAILRRSGESGEIRNGEYYLACLCLGVAAIFSALDASRVFCDPDNHWIQGHAIWHVLSALSLYFCFRFYGRIDYTRLS